MNTRITPLVLGYTTCYLLQDQGCVLIDSGTPGQRPTFLKKLKQLAVDPKEIRLLLLTHGHIDHIGSAAELKAVTGAPLALHRGDARQVEQGVTVPVKGITPWGRIIAAFSHWVGVGFNVPALGIDIPLGDEDRSLEPYGIPGKIIATPGHTLGSVSVLLNSGQAFVGDLAMNMAPLRFSPGLSIFGEDAGKVKASCAKVLDQGAEIIYPAHGKPFNAQILRRALS